MQGTLYENLQTRAKLIQKQLWTKKSKLWANQHIFQYSIKCLRDFHFYRLHANAAHVRLFMQQNALHRSANDINLTNSVLELLQHLQKRNKIKAKGTQESKALMTSVTFYSGLSTGIAVVNGSRRSGSLFLGPCPTPPKYFTYFFLNSRIQIVIRFQEPRIRITIQIATKI